MLNSALRWLVTFVPLALLVPAHADDPKPTAKVVPAAEAKAHLNQECTVEMTVRLSKNAEKHKEFYLDSEADFHDPKNVAIVISYDHLAAFTKAGVDDPSKHYLDKKIRVTGTLKKEGEQVRIRVTDPKQIEVVKDKAP